LSRCESAAPAKTSCLAESLHDLAAWRGIEPRLSGSFAWQPCTRVLPAGHAVELALCPGPHPPPPLVSLFPESCDPVGRRHAEALRTLILAPDRTEEAVEVLAKLADETPRDARVLSDLSAAYRVRAQRADQPADLLLSFAAAERAVGSSALPEACFNFVLAAESLQLDGAAPRLPAGDDFCHEAPTAWAAEAKARWQRLRAVLGAGAEPRPGPAWQGLPEALREGDGPAVARLVRAYPDLARRYLEEQALPVWARSQGPDAARQLAMAGRVAGELARATGDRYLADAVAAIVEAGGPCRRAERLRALRLGHRALGEARLAERANDWRRAAAGYRQARRYLAAGRSPLQAGADLGIAIALYQRLGEVSPAQVLARLAPLDRDARRHEFRYLEGRVQWMRAVCLVLQGRAVEALAAYDQALERFTRMGDAESSAGVRARKAGVLRLLGENDLAWREIVQALPQLPRMVELQARHHVLGEAAAVASALGHPDIALRYQDRAVRLIDDELAASPSAQTARIAGLRVNLAISLRQRAVLRLRAGHPDAARSDLDRAVNLAALPSDANVRRALQARVREAEGELLGAADPARAVERLQEALRLSPTGEFHTLRAALSFELAQAYRRLGLRDQAMRTLEQGIQELRQEESALLAGRVRGEGEELWSGAFSRFQQAYQLLVELLVEENRPEEAFAYAEKARAFEPLDLVLHLPYAPGAFRRLAAHGNPLGLAEVRRHLPPGTLLIEYCALPDRLFIWLVWRGGSEVLSRNVGQAQLQEWSERLLEDARHRDAKAFESALAAPFADLIGAPLARAADAGLRPEEITKLVFVPDGAIHSLPLGALHERRSRRYLIEDRPVAIAPSATLYVFSLLRDRQLVAGEAPSALLVGDPAFDPGSDPRRRAERLPRAAVEVERIRGYYPQAVVLTGRAATVGRFLSQARHSAVVHFAGHAIVNPRSPFQSMLLLAPGAGRVGALSAAEILGALQLENTRLVVLSACSSAGGHPIGAEGIAALVRPLLAAGVPAVVGSLWDVGDDPAEELMVEFHRQLAMGKDVESALQSAQLHLIGARNEGMRSALAWAAFQVIGHASSPFRSAAQPSRRDSP
jgi:CHAT domain-containing protein